MVKRGLMMLLWGALVLAGFSAAVMLLWNFVVADIFGIVAINIWQALGLLVLSRILFGSFGGFRGRGGRGMWGGMHGKGHNPMHDKWMKMTPEQRKEFINKRKKFGFGGPFGERNFFDNDRFGMNDNPNNQPQEPKKENE